MTDQTLPDSKRVEGTSAMLALLRELADRPEGAVVRMRHGSEPQAPIDPPSPLRPAAQEPQARSPTPLPSARNEPPTPLRPAAKERAAPPPSPAPLSSDRNEPPTPLRPAAKERAAPPPSPAPLRHANELSRASLRSPIESPSPPPAFSPPVVSDSMRAAAIAGWSIIILFFGVLGAWAVTAPLHGAVVANAVIKVQGNRKSVQHLDGGIVKELRVTDGSQVAAGDVLIVLDETQARAEHDVLSQQYMVLRATEARLMAELNRAAEPVPSAEIKARLDEPDVSGIWNGQSQQFESRRMALEGQRSIIKEKINQLKAQIEGGEKQIVSLQQQLGSVRKELESILPLVERGLIAQPRRNQLERSAFALEGQIEDAIANIAKFRQAIAEQIQSMAQLDNDRMAEVTRDLRDTQAKLLEVIPRLMNAKAALGRMEIRSPYSGQVVGLSVFAVGAVIQRGDKILDIVPADDSLTIEAQIAVEDISEVHPGMGAEVHLTAYKQRITPMIHGEVIHVSADRLTDNRSGNPYYTALVRLDERELAGLPNIKLYPGMPATVMIQTVQRTAFDYLVGPLVMSFNHAFRQK